MRGIFTPLFNIIYSIFLLFYFCYSLINATPTTIRVMPTSCTNVICLFIAPIQPRPSIRRLSAICPSKSAMKNAPVPICGISQALPNTEIAPHTPPSHIHHGLPLAKALRTRHIFPFPMQTAAMTAVAIRNDTVELRQSVW